MFRLLFNSVGVVIRSVELNDQVKTESSELKQEETEELSQSQILGTCFVIYPSATASDSDSGFH